MISRSSGIVTTTEGYGLCFVEGSWAWFTDDVLGAWGDDWNDAPHDCNAGWPYEDRGRFVKVAYDGDLHIVGTEQHGDGVGRWGYLSVEDINHGRAPWLVQLRYGAADDDGHVELGVQIAAGTALKTFRKLVAGAGGRVYEAR